MLNELERRIVAALQVDGRAPWARIAAVLGEPDRTVARKGADLIASGSVRIRALLNPAHRHRFDQIVVRFTSTPGAATITAAAMARRPECIFSYVLTGSADCAAQLSVPSEGLSGLYGNDIGAMPGVITSVSYPVLSHLLIMHQWNPGILSATQIADLGGDRYIDTPIERVRSAELGADEQRIAKSLSEDGRASLEDLARASSLSVQSIQRRIERMRADGTLYVRAVFEPALLGLPVEALLWVKAPFQKLDAIGARIRQSPAVRYVSVLAGDYQLLVDAVFADRAALYDYLRTESWVAETQSVEPTIVIDALKRSATLSRAFGSTATG